MLHAQRPVSTARSEIIINGNHNGSLAEWRGSELLIHVTQVRSLQDPPAPHAISSADRAPRFERGGRRFESVMACQFYITSNLFRERKQNSSQNALSAGEAREFLPGALGR
jgi:hypothetical protein